MTEVDDFLAHYGVKGMRWGKRKSEKVISDKTQSKREARAQKFLAKASDIDGRINKLKASGYSSTGMATRIQELEVQKQTALKDADAKRQGKLSSTQKKVIIGTSIVAAAAATYVLQDKVQSGEMTRLIAKGRERLTGEKFEFKKNDKLADRNMGVDDIFENVVKHVNPDYGKIGTKMNCRRATFSYEMRRRGYDVKATKTTNGNGQTAFGLHKAISPHETNLSTGKINSAKTFFKESMADHGPKPVTNLLSGLDAGSKTRIPEGSKPSAIFDKLAKEPDGSRGELGVMWKMGGGHSMAYEVVKGKPVIFDAQSGKKLDTPEAFAKAMGSVKDAGYTRLDNQPLNEEFLMKWMTNA